MDTSDLEPLPAGSGERHVLAAEEELRLEIGFSKGSTCRLTLRKGSCELQGVELALGKPYVFCDGGYKLALFTWHGCVMDVECPDHDDLLESSYTSDETAANIASLNTHAQLEALRDEAAAAAAAAATGNNNNNKNEGPRVLICGPPESGKSSLARILTAYATKLGRTPIQVDLDPADNALSVPGTLAACPMDREAVTVASFAATSVVPAGTAAPLVLWHGSTDLVPDLFQAQVTALGQKLDARLNGTTNSADDWARSSGIIVNTNGWIQDEGYQLLLHTISALRINVVLVMGHDRLYSMLKSKLVTKAAAASGDDATSKPVIKVIKLPRSGGVVSRGKEFVRQHRSRSVKRYFYGESVPAAVAGGAGGDSSSAAATSGSATGAAAGAASASTAGLPKNIVPQLTPFLAQVPFKSLQLYKFAVMSLSASLLPVTASQATEPVQLQSVPITASLQHSVVAVCHPAAAQAYQASGQAKDLYQSGVAGFCVVERVLMESEMVHLLSPCAGSLPSHTLLVGDLTWME